MVACLQAGTAALPPALSPTGAALRGQVVCRRDAGSSATEAAMEDFWQVYTHGT